MNSPYSGLSVSEWLRVTQEIVERHPLSAEEIVDAVLASWESILDSRLGTKGFRIGKDIFPKPQIMGFLLHELIPLELAAKHPNNWRGDTSSSDKDLVYIPDDSFSIEVKTSSDPKHIYGNRSYAQGASKGKKGKSGYYLAVNFEKFSDTRNSSIRLIRFGWIDSNDWIGQKAATGQQSRLSSDVENYKLLQLYRKI
ncbi:ScaI family restriction endonuclease [Microcoleus sp. FACHB-68]|uniref:ScaI family restriction endonuclease n=1 Tax=Microcoleus sp. FACHB-68 TaxID=2692826 RepID=UPI001684A103|nr:ScaI family restriction endonuclease [Microcoleus sp. FACHB-68]MBD1936757.1 ScaI family restriction endonuclease [Microcoleus sp. FACHB-68]